jgi:hypothetical protein
MDTEALGKFAGALVSGLSNPQNYQETKKEKKARKKEAQQARWQQDMESYAIHGIARPKFLSQVKYAEIHQPEHAATLRFLARHVRQQAGLEPAPHLAETDQGVPREYQGQGVQYGERSRETAETYQGDPSAVPAPGAVAGGPPVDMNTVLGTMDKSQYDDAVNFACEYNVQATRNGKAPMTWEEAVQLRAQGKTRFDLGF